ncbi:MAG TPA: fumarylacetoacetate hydrolase [Rhodobacteraceae bacterium]|nr:fumarylacetoacetate hydrolase [Paracoccaceae bacterium]
MTDFIFPIPTPSIKISGRPERFAVRRIFCVGRNYAEHAKEFGNDERDPPFFFTKPADAVVPSGAALTYPSLTQDLHHEAELVVAIGTGGRDILAKDAASHIFGFACGNDLTRRDLQAVAKSQRRPWDMSKAFDESAVIGEIVPGQSLSPDAAIRCRVDGQLRQNAKIGDMTWPVADVIAALSYHVSLAAGDLIMTGTPAGVGPVAKGQTCCVEIDGLPEAKFRYAV